MALSWPSKDPDEVLDYVINWADRLDTDTILSSTWVLPDSITKDSANASVSVTTIWLSGGVVSETAIPILNRIVTNGGRTMDQTVNIVISHK